ncbi:dipeptide epimerase [Sphingomonas sp. MS122]|uniref:dipeptide epimerase n=1 Tax=Sphingomonas sp. MS122 TaxID=3412683 RepID=UPI003C2D57D2
MKLDVRVESWPMRSPFRISGKEFTSAEIVVVEARDGAHRGRGEACGVYYTGDLPDRIVAQVEALKPALDALDRDSLQHLLPAGGARNAVDCALWELDAARAGKPVWQLAGLDAVRALPTVFTIGIDSVERMANQASGMTHARAIKVKLAGDHHDAARVRAVRAARPDAWLGIDANRGFDRAGFLALLPVLHEARVALIEQPFAIGREGDMAGIDRSIPVAADESVQQLADLSGLVGLFDIVNIKLDKCGGLTHALAMEREARRLGFRVMVGNMTGTSWSQAAGFVLGQRCDFIDLDGPTFLAGDRDPAVRYVDGMIHCIDAVWGLGTAA